MLEKQMSMEIKYNNGGILEKRSRVFQTLKDVQMDILGEMRTIPEIRVSYTKDGEGRINRCISFDEWNRISDEIHRELRERRKVYHGNY